MDRDKKGRFLKGYTTWNKGKPMSEAHKEKNRLAHLGKISSEETKIKIGKAIKKLGIKPPSWLGKHHSEETKIKLRESHSGEKCYNWKGGITPFRTKIWRSKQYQNWRKEVFERDDYTCQKCGARNGNGKEIYLIPHHIKSFAKYPELRFILNNGITLCEDCHKKTDNY
ncbi:HNH endonuclease, partial [Candidatus Atribacteria bacterium 1244-E10-H5-B2]